MVRHCRRLKPTLTKNYRLPSLKIFESFFFVCCLVVSSFACSKNDAEDQRDLPLVHISSQPVESDRLSRLIDPELLKIR